MNNDTTLKGLIRKLKKPLIPPEKMPLKKLAKIIGTISQTREKPKTPETGSCSGKLYILLQNPIR
jgi:hypothetical protein